MGYFYLLIAIIGEVIGTTHLKSTNNFTELLPTTYVVLGFATAFYFMMLAMKTIPIAIAYSIWAAIGISAITILGRTLGNSEGFAILTSGLEELVLKYLFSKLIICLSRDLAFFPPKTMGLTA